MDPERRKALLAALDGDQSFEDIVREFARPVDVPVRDEIAVRASMVSYFDRRLYDEVIVKGLPPNVVPLSFANFVERDDVEPVPRSAGWRMTEQARDLWSRQWKGSELEAYRRELIRYYEGLGPAAELELLEHQIEVAPDAAQKRIMELFSEADRDFDTVRFQSLLRLIANRIRGGFPEMYASQAARLRARTLFVEDYYKTVLFYSRPAALEKVEDLLSEQNQSWMMMLHAEGGAGKTMFLRWLAARRFVEQDRLPVAYVDLDDFSLDIAAQYPWLLWLPVLQQWKEQIVQTGLESVFISYERFLPLLRRGSRGVTNPLGKSIGLEQEFAAGAYNMLNTLRLSVSSMLEQVKTPLIAIVDTCEEASLHRPQILASENQAVPGLVDLFSEMRSRGLRLILSGRYDLLEKNRFPLFRERYEKVAQSYSPPTFEDHEATDYLRNRRRLQSEDLIAAITAKSKGIPFRLSLLADLTLGGDLKTPQDVYAAREDFAYLIDRVVNRIPEVEVRWIVRYGVVPRRLDHQFVMEVMLKHLERETRQDEYDRPDRRYWIASKPDPEQGWRRLMDYASAYGWVRPIEGGLQFGPEVRRPLRRILSDERVYRLLHEDAADWFRRKAVADRANWVRWKSEELYHVMQLDPAVGIGEWRRLLTSGDPPSLQARWSIVSLLFDRDFLEVDEEGQRSHDPALLAEAHFELASVAAQQASLEPLGPRRIDRWTEATREYEAGKKQARAAGQKVIGPDQRDLLKGAVLMGSMRYAEAVALHRRFFQRDNDPQYCIAMLVQHATALFALNQDGANAFEEAWRKARTLPSPWIQPHLIGLRLVEELFRNGYDLIRLRNVYGSILEELEFGRPEYENIKLRYALQVLIPSGDLRLARQTFTDRRINQSEYGFAASFVFAEVAFRSASLADAQRHNADAQQAAGATSGNRYWVAMALEQKGRIEGAYMDAPSAIASFAEAKTQFEAAESAMEGALCKMRMSDVAFEISGDTALALTYLFDVSEGQLRLQPFLLTRWLARRIRLHAARAEDVELRDCWARLKDHLLVLERNPAFQVVGWAAAFAAGVADRESVERLAMTLELIQPPAARISPVEMFRWWNEDNDPLKILPDLPEPDPQALDWAMQQITVADYDRARGRRKAAATRIKQTWQRLGNTIELPLWYSLMRVSRRLGLVTTQPLPEGPDTPLRDFALLECAQRASGEELNELAKTLTDKASRYLGTAFDAANREVQGRAAMQQGQMQVAERYLHGAETVYSQLGLKLQRGATTSESFTGGKAVAARSLVTLRLEVGREIRMEWLIDDSIVSEAYLPSELSERILAGGYEGIAHTMISEPSGQSSVHLAISRSLSEMPDPADVRMLVPHGRATAWPWERIVRSEYPEVRCCYRAMENEKSSRETVRWLQAALARLPTEISTDEDGQLGPLTLNAVATVQRSFGLNPTKIPDRAFMKWLVQEMRSRHVLKVLVLNPHPQLEHRFGRGYGFAGVNVPELWRNAGCDVDVLEAPHLSEVAINADIVHITAGFEEGRGEVRLRMTWDPAPASELHRAIGKSLRRNGSVPTIILDPPRPDADYEVFRQLALRNALADELFRQRTSWAVMGCGLLPEHELAQVSPTLVAALVGETLAEAAASFRSCSSERDMPTALFCHDPDLPAWSTP